MVDVFQPDAALLPLLPTEANPFADHVFFEAEMSSKGWAVYHQMKPERLDNGNTRYGLRIPILTAFDGLASPQAGNSRVAELLNKHWHDGERSRG